MAQTSQCVCVRVLNVCVCVRVTKIHPADMTADSSTNHLFPLSLPISM